MERGEKILTSLVQLWAHQNNQQIEEIEIWKKGEEKGDAKKVHIGTNVYGSGDSVYISRNA